MNTPDFCRRVGLSPALDSPTRRQKMGSAGLLLVAHGSRDERHAATMGRIAAATATAAGRPVRVGYLDHHGPDVTEAARLLVADGASALSVVPLLLSEAFHRKVDVPAAVAAARMAVDVNVRLVPALGPDPVLLVAAHRRLRDCGGGDGAVVLAYAGTTDSAAAASVTRLARIWQARWGTATRAAHAGSTGPDLANAVGELRALGAERIEVATWFLAPGRLSAHVQREAAKVGANVVSEPLGDSPEVVAAVLSRAGVRRATAAA